MANANALASAKHASSFNEYQWVLLGFVTVSPITDPISGATAWYAAQTDRRMSNLPREQNGPFAFERLSR